MQIRNTQSFKLEQTDEFVRKALFYADTFEHFCYFNPHDYTYPYQPFRHLLFIGSHRTFTFGSSKRFDDLRKYIDTKDFLYCHLGYDLKNEVENLSSKNRDSTEFPDIGLVQPQVVLEIYKNKIEIKSFGKPSHIFNQIDAIIPSCKPNNPTSFKPRVSKTDYLKTVEKLKEHIIEGDMYEINYCQEFISNNTIIDPIHTYLKLSTTSPSPFSVLYKKNGHYLISMTPERFLKKEGSKLISQPIKGTSKRGANKTEDEVLKNTLRNSEKEMAENMMIVDLVRNDLSKSCMAGTVEVDEMFGVYTFPLWHQMISTVSGRVKPNLDNATIIKNAFPMGSMTGAPKVKVMELIEQYENSKRGIYSGTIGYFLPNGDFDFNVVIRSLVYSTTKQICSFHVGGAITFDSDPNEEYEECLIKAKTISSVFKIEH